MSNIKLGADITLTDKLNITRPVTINGQGHTFSKGIIVSSNNVVIENATITPSEFDPGWYYGIMVANVTGVVLRNNTITGNGLDEVGISDETANTNAGITIEGNVLSNLWTAVLIDSANTHANISSNVISDAKHGIYVTRDQLTNVTVTSNSISNPKAITSPAGPGDAISVPNGTNATKISTLKSQNTFSGVAAGKDVVVLP